MKDAYQKLVTYFHNPVIQQNIRESKEEQWQEGFLIELFVKIFGYTINPNPEYNLTTEFKNERGAKKADGAILKEGTAIGVIELKSTSTKDLEAIRLQAFDYKANQTKCIYVITSNFEKIRFYINNAVDFEEFDLFRIEYEEFQLLWLCLAKENLLKGIPLEIKQASLLKEENVTKQIYIDYSAFKRDLYNDLIQNNLKLAIFTGKEEKEIKLLLFKKSQKLLDRFLFIFFGEDRGLLPPNSISGILKQWEELKEMDEYKPLYERYKKYFNYLNTGWKGKQYEIFAYNGGLFLADEVLDNIIISDEVLQKHTKVLTGYDFETDVDVNILGHIFENSLNEIEEVAAQIEGAEVDLKKSKRKKDGVFYTPKYITKYIVENTVGKLCEEKKTELEIDESEYLKSRKGRTTKKLKELDDKINDYRNWLLQLTICDPACGSGAFLNQALDFLIREHHYIDELQAKLLDFPLVFKDVENSILENNIYGVDINEESVEIAKLSLWLRTAQKGRKLTTLSNNIKCGNSLIDAPEVAGEKAFNWQNEFPDVFKKGGFDVVIGNPPYVRSRDEILNDYKSYYYQHFNCIHEKPNLYLLFMERAFDLLKSNSLMSFIVPNSWLGMESGKKLRKRILEESKLISIIGLTGKSFEGVGVETVIYVLNKSIPENNKSYYANTDCMDVIIPNLSKINQSVWIENRDYIIDIVSKGGEIEVINKIKLNQNVVGDLYDVRVGMQAYEKGKGNPPQTIGDVENHVFDYSFKYDNDTYKYLEGRDIGRYTHNWSGTWLRWGEWLSQPKDFKQFSEPRILIREITGKFPQVLIASYLDDTFLNNKSIINILQKNKDVPLKPLLSILNSKLIGFYHERQAVKGNRTLFPKAVIKDVKNYPIPILKDLEKLDMSTLAVSNLNLTSKLTKIANSFLELLRSKYNLEKLSKKLQNWHELEFKDFLKELNKAKVKLSLSEEAEWMQYFNGQKQKAQNLKSEIDKTDREIDRMVYQLYGLTEEEIKIVEEN